MTSQQLILINSDKVRRDSSLMAFYIECFIEAFGYKPTCTGCTFSSDWNKLVRFINKGETVNAINQNKNTMNTFKLKKTENKIHAYKFDNKVYRKYDNKFDEAFAVGFLTNGTEAEITERKKLFAVLPDAFKNEIEVVETNNEETEGEEITEVEEIVKESKPKQKRKAKK